MDLVTSQPIVVTGGNGFLGSHIIQQLLFRGYRVRATIRPKPDEAVNLSSLYSPYSRIAGIENKLEFIEADLADSAIWESVITNEIEYVVHTANPFVFKPENPQAEILSPAVEGTRKILELCQASTSVKKFIYISCASALTDEFDSIKVYNESDWNSTSSLTRNPIAYSKTMTEKLVHSFAGQVGCRFSLVTILPGIMLGPLLVGKTPTFSHRFLTAFLNGSAKAILNLHYNISDVRDVAHAIILSMEQPKIEGRYCFCNEPLPLSEILQIIHENFTVINVPKRKVTDFVVRLAHGNEKTYRGEYLYYSIGRIGHINCSRSVEAGMILRPQVQTILDTIRNLLENDMIEEEKQSSCVIA